MGLEAVDPDLIAASNGADVTTPSGMLLSGSVDKVDPSPALSPFADPDGDGVVHEIPVALVDHFEFYLLNYFLPARYQETDESKLGETIFAEIGCTKCHVPDLEINFDRRVANVETAFAFFPPLPDGRRFLNDLRSNATPQHHVIHDHPTHPPLKPPLGQPFKVKGIFADFKRHDLGPNFWEKNFRDPNVPPTQLFMTEPLWSVATTGPYGHDGRSINLREVILRHGGEAQPITDAFRALSPYQQSLVLTFLETLVLFPPFDTRSNLDPGNPLSLRFPIVDHGSIKLSVLFNDPTNLE